MRCAGPCSDGRVHAARPGDRTGGRTVDRHRRGPPPPVLVTGGRKGMMVHQGSHGTLSVGETIFSDRPTLHRERSGSVPPVSKHGPRSLTRTQGHAEKEEKERRSSAGVSWPPWFQQPRGPDPGGRSKVRPGHDDRVRSPKRKRVVGTYRIHQVGGDGLRLSRLQDARRAVSTTRAFPSLPEGSYSVCVPGPGVIPPGTKALSESRTTSARRVCELGPERR